jgi:hypothetical protein
VVKSITRQTVGALALLGLFAGAAAPVALADSGPGKGSRVPSKLIKVEGVIVGLSANVVTIRTRGGATTAVIVTAQTKLERNERHIRLTELRVGDRAEAEVLMPSGEAMKLEAIGPVD